MVMRVCIERGELRPTEAIKRMTAADVTLYQAWYRRHPFGDETTQYLLAQLTALIYNQKRKETSEPSKPTDWLPWYIPPEQTSDEIFAQLRSAKRGSRG